MLRGYETVEALAEQTGATLVPGHDPAVCDRFPEAGELLPGSAVRLA